MRHEVQQQFVPAAPFGTGVDVTIVMPCLDEAISLPTCIANAAEALKRMEQQFGLTGEILIADNGSKDGSQQIATRLGARVVAVPIRGYGAAMIGGGQAANGRMIVFGDADGSYDFTESVAMVGELLKGADVCMGSRFAGGIADGAMPWKNRYIGNPLLTGVLNLFFRSGIGDAHCGLRAVTAEAFARLRLTGRGMEFASEMVIKAALLGLRMTETPATLSPDLRDRPPHLRPWRDGWRHLRYLLMLSPTWVFGVPAAAMLIAGLAIFLLAFRDSFLAPQLATFGTSWTIVAGALVGMGHIASLLAGTAHLYGVRQGYRRSHSPQAGFARAITLESMLIGGCALAAAGAALLTWVGVHWASAGYTQLKSVLALVSGTTLLVLGMQNILGGFLLAIVGGNEAAFFAAEGYQADQELGAAA